MTPKRNLRSCIGAGPYRARLARRAPAAGAALGVVEVVDLVPLDVLERAGSRAARCGRRGCTLNGVARDRGSRAARGSRRGSRRRSGRACSGTSRRGAARGPSAAARSPRSPRGSRSRCRSARARARRAGSSATSARGVEVVARVAGVLRGRQRESGIEAADRGCALDAATLRDDRTQVGERARRAVPASSVDVVVVLRDGRRRCAPGPLANISTCAGVNAEPQEVHRRGGVVAREALLVLVGRLAAHARCRRAARPRCGARCRRAAAATRAARRRT